MTLKKTELLNMWDAVCADAEIPSTTFISNTRRAAVDYAQRVALLVSMDEAAMPERIAELEAMLQYAMSGNVNLRDYMGEVIKNKGTSDLEHIQNYLRGRMPKEAVPVKRTKVRVLPDLIQRFSNDVTAVRDLQRTGNEATVAVFKSIINVDRLCDEEEDEVEIKFINSFESQPQLYFEDIHRMIDALIAIYCYVRCIGDAGRVQYQLTTTPCMNDSGVHRGKYYCLNLKRWPIPKSPRKEASHENN